MNDFENKSVCSSNSSISQKTKVSVFLLDLQHSKKTIGERKIRKVPTGELNIESGFIDVPDKSYASQIRIAHLN